MPLRIRNHIRYEPAAPKPIPQTANGSGIARKCKPWTDVDDALVRKSYDPFDPVPLANALGRTVQAVRTRASFLGLTISRAAAARAAWFGKRDREPTQVEAALIDGVPTGEIMERFRVSNSAVQGARRRLRQKESSRESAGIHQGHGCRHDG